MKALVVINESLVPVHGGGVPRTLSIIKGLRWYGHEVYVVASALKEPKETARTLDCSGFFPIRSFKKSERHKLLNYLIYTPIWFFKILYATDKIRPQIIIAHNPHMGLGAVFAKLVFKNVIVVVDFTDLLVEYLASFRQGVLTRLSLFLGKKMENLAIRKSDYIFAVSNTLKEELIRRGFNAQKISVFYDGAFSDFFKPLSESIKYREKYAAPKTVVIYQGGMDHQDGLDIVIDAASCVVQKHPNTAFWMVGDGNMLPRLKDLVSNKNLDAFFLFTGWVPFDEMPFYISASDIALVILPNSISANIRMTLKVYEAWACEKPVIAPRLSALQEVIKERENGLFYEVENPQSLAEAISYLIENRELAQKIARKGRELVESEFDWNKLGKSMAKRLEMMVSHMTNSKSRARKW